MTLYQIHIGATNRSDIGVVHDGMSLKEAMALVPEGMGLRIMEGVNGSILFGVPVEPDLYVYLQGGMSRSFYQCDRSEADGAVFDINLFRDKL